MRSIPRNSSQVVLLLMLAAVGSTTGCKSKSADGTAAAPSEAAPEAATPTTTTPDPEIGSVDALVAPVALYPDLLLAQVMMIAATPQEVLDVGSWLLENRSLRGDALTSAARDAGFTPSAQYLVLFPQEVDNMCRDMGWTTQLGEAVTADQQAVMQAVQRKRLQAQQQGNLLSSPQMAVATKKAEDGASYIEIVPADPKVVYVPQYNPVTIFVAAGTGHLSFGTGTAVGSAIDNDDYYPYPSWGYGGMHFGGRPYYPPPYRAPRYPGYRAKHTCTPPSSKRHQ